MSRISSERRASLWERFLSIRKRPLPTGTELPSSPEEAARIGFQRGLQAGWGEGLVEGVGLGLDVHRSPAITSDEPLTDLLN